MSTDGVSQSGSGQSPTESEWRQWLASPPPMDACGCGGWLPPDEATSSRQIQWLVHAEEEPEEDPEEEPEEDPEEEVPEDVQEEVQEPAVDVGHHEEQHIGPEDFEEDMEDWDENLDDLEEGDEEFVWGDEDPESGLDEEPMPIRPPRPTHYYADKYYASQHRHTPVPLHPRDPYFPDFGYDHPPPAKRARVEPEVPQLRHEDIEQLLQAVNRLCDELQQARKEKGFLSSIWDWFRRRF